MATPASTNVPFTVRNGQLPSYEATLEAVRMMSNPTQRRALSPEDQKAVDFCLEQFQGIKEDEAIINSKKSLVKDSVRVIKNDDGSVTFIPHALIAQGLKGWVSEDDIQAFRECVKIHTDATTRNGVNTAVDDSDDALLTLISEYANGTRSLSKEERDVVSLCKGVFAQMQSDQTDAIASAKEKIRSIVKCEISNNTLRVVPLALIAQASLGWVSKGDLVLLKDRISAFKECGRSTGEDGWEMVNNGIASAQNGVRRILSFPGSWLPSFGRNDSK